MTIGYRDQLAADIITVLDRDEVLATFDSYLSERFINFTPENPEVNPPTPLPCKAVELFHHSPPKDGKECTGGAFKNDETKVCVTVFLDPNDITADTPTLNDLGERVEKQLEDASLLDNFPDTFTGSTVKEYKRGDTYVYPYHGAVNRVLKKVADSVKCEFTIKLNVMR
jgi:hypothetical protein